MVWGTAASAGALIRFMSLLPWLVMSIARPSAGAIRHRLVEGAGIWLSFQSKMVGG